MSSHNLKTTTSHNVFMADSGLFALYKLHLVDSALNDMKQRAAALDMGKAEAAQIKELELDPEGHLTESRKLSAELKDLELEQKSFDDKIKKLDSDLYGGKIVNPKEVQNIEKERKNIVSLRNSHDMRILELWEILPPLKELAAHLEKQISALKTKITEKQNLAKAEHEQIQSAYTAKSKERSPLVKAVPPLLLSQYEKLREKLGVGMVLITNEQRCSVCGMQVSARITAFVVEDKILQCEGCRRILFKLQQTL